MSRYYYFQKTAWTFRAHMPAIRQLEIQTRLIDAIEDLCFVLSLDFSILFCNRKVTEEFSRREEELRGLDFRSLVREEPSDSFQEKLRHLRVNQSTDLMVKLHAFGKELIGDVRVHRTTIQEGEVFVLTIRDATAEQEKELDLLRFSSVIEHTINPIQITDANARMVYVNPAFERSTGYSRDELIGKNPGILKSGKHGKAFWREVWKTILRGESWIGEIENRRKNGEPLHTQLIIAPIIDSSGKVVGFLGAHSDITKQKILEQELARSQKMESIGTLAAGIAHEVGNPLASISSVVQVIQRSTSEDFVKEKLELVKNQINRISTVIRQLVDFSRPSDYEPRPTDVNAILREAVTIVQYGKKAKHVRFDLQLEDPIPLLKIVPDQIVQVFINILMNAVDSLEGKPGEVSVRTFTNEDAVCVSIQDTGKGILGIDLEKIFDPFFTTKDIGYGSGLGLWVSYGIVKSFDGDITVQSKEGEGSTFTVILPVDRKV
ncbi:MAG: PAS domain S-box protein [Bacteroidota bacterium]